MADLVQLQLLDQGSTLITVEDFSFAKKYMDPGGSFSIQISGSNLGEMVERFQNFQRVSLVLNEAVIMTGYMVSCSTSESTAGTSLTIQGQSSISRAARQTVDPDMQFADSTKLHDLLKALFEPAGYTSIKADDRVARQQMTKTTKRFVLDEHMEVVEKAMVNPISSKYKPQKSEGVYEFAKRIGRRFGAHPFDSPDGKTLYFGAIDYESEALYQFTSIQSSQNANNIISMDIVADWDDQPSVLIVEGRGGGGKKAKASIRTLVYNEFLCGSKQAIPEAEKRIAKYKSMVVLTRDSRVQVPARILPITQSINIVSMKDDESKTQEQLNNYARSVMADFQSKFFKIVVKVAGASQLGVNYAVNTCAHVKNEIWGIDAKMWISSVKIRGSKSSGTTTELELLPLYSIRLSDGRK